ARQIARRGLRLIGGSTARLIRSPSRRRRGAMTRDFEAQRRRMVARRIAARGIRDAALLEAMRAVPRERFVDPQLAEFAYEDSPLPIGSEQTISQPYIVAAMIEAAEIGPDDRVLEVG